MPRATKAMVKNKAAALSTLYGLIDKSSGVPFKFSIGACNYDSPIGVFAQVRFYEKVSQLPYVCFKDYVQ